MNFFPLLINPFVHAHAYAHIYADRKDERKEKEKRNISNCIVVISGNLVRNTAQCNLNAYRHLMRSTDL